MNNVKSLKEIVKQLRSCGYTCEAGPLENNVDFQMLEKIAGFNTGGVVTEHTAILHRDFVIPRSGIGNPHYITFMRSPQEIRDDIVEQAKRDVAEIDERGIDVKAKGGSEGNETYRDSFYEVIFNVNKEKRTVVSLIKGATGDGRVFGVRHRGIAKCAPDDCFNVHIGKAIALRRALGLVVPTKYLSAPQPTEVRVGDVIESKWINGSDPDPEYEIVSAVDGDEVSYKSGGWDFKKEILNSGDDELLTWICDDSRDGAGQEV